MMISIRLPARDPAHAAFADLTHAWLEEFREDFRRSTGAPFEGGSGVLMASDVLVELHDRNAAWSLFDVSAFERWVRTEAPDFSVALGSMIADLGCFTNFLARKGRIDPERALATQQRFFELLPEHRPTSAPPPAPRAPGGPRVRPSLDAAERIAATKRSRRRRH